MTVHNILGQHVFGEFYQVPFELLDDEEIIRNAIITAVYKSNMHLVKLEIVKFVPQGITAFGILSESHISIHTYPEWGYAAIDVFTCGTEGNPQKAIEELGELLMPKEKSVTKVFRGIEGESLCPGLGN